MSPSDPALEARALELLDEALERPSAERRAWADAVCGDDTRLKRRLDALLDAADREGPDLVTGGAPASLAEEAPPTRIGAYRVVERLGRGGMGAVYLAARDAGDFDHVVAIKVIRPGALSAALVQRFERERQILAGLAHPHIARLFDGGRTPDGQPFIVMEYVSGAPVTTWARDHSLDLAACLRLFLSICEAVRHAHQNLVVHRDLTPGNVLVTAEGTVKLIDFGIARPPETRAEEGAQASLAGLSLTPGFAAPERLSGAGASTLVDIYSLGRLLEALTAHLPGDRETAAIAARAAAADPQARYASADALAQDVRNRLTGRPVVACGGGRRYAVGKFICRHRRAVLATGTAVALLVGALAATLVAYDAAARARSAEARRFAELRSLAGYMVFELDGRLSRVPGNTQARVDLARRAQRYLSALAASATTDDGLKVEAARGLITLANVQGVPAQPNLGDAAQARGNLLAALKLLDSVAGDPGEAAPERVRAHAALAQVAMNIDTDQPAADRHIAQAQAALAAAPTPDRGERWVMARRVLRRAQLEAAVLAHRPPALSQLADLIEVEVAQWPPALRSSHEAALDVAYAHQYRAIRGYFTDDLAASVASAQEAERRLVALDRALPNDPETLYAKAWNAYTGYGAASGLPDGGAESERFLESARATVARLLTIEENDQSLKSFGGQIRQAQSQALSAAGRHAEATAAQAEVLALFKAGLGPTRRPLYLNKLVAAEVTMGDIAIRAADRPLACASFQRAQANLDELTTRGGALGSMSRMGPKLRSNLDACAKGAPLSALIAVE